MHRIDSDGATPANRFTEGNPATSTPATIVSADWLNAVQGELTHLIEEAGLTLLTSGTDTEEQVFNAILEIIQKGGVVYTQSIANDTGPADVGAAGELEFDPAEVSAVLMDYRIERRTDSSNVLEVGEMQLAYDTESSSWRNPHYQGRFDDADVVFTMGSVGSGPNAGFGKLQYTSGDLTGTSYSGSLKISNVRIIKQ